ncbi:MAG: LexA family transcriptional regulator [Deltaproteobacteria bacterium]|nr:LexA family transcriptional regulator [Deltaproteobacteria bacterium]
MPRRKTPPLSSPSKNKIRDFIDDEKSLGRATKGQIAAAIGIRPSHFSNLLNGRNEWKLNQLEKLAEFLGVPLTRLFAERGKESPERPARRNREVELEDSVRRTLRAEARGLRAALRRDLDLLLRERISGDRQSLPGGYATDDVPADYWTEGVDLDEALPVEMRELDAAYDASGAAQTPESVWFGRDWLRRQRLDSTQCLIVRIQDDSMAETLPDGCSVLVNRRQRQRHAGRIFALRTEDRLLIRRAGRDASGAWLLECDHPAWATVAWPDDAKVVGEVRWMARTF